MASGLRRPTRSDAGRATAVRESGKAEPERAGDPKRRIMPEDSGKRAASPAEEQGDYRRKKQVAW